MNKKELKKELKYIDDFFNSLSEETFFKMMDDCGVHEILPTSMIFKEQQVLLNGSYKPIGNTNISKSLGEYTDYNDGVERGEAV